MITFTQNQIEDSRGKGILDLLNFLRQIFHGNLQEMTNSLLPILTHVKSFDASNPEDIDFDLDSEKHRVYEKLSAHLNDDFLRRLNLTSEFIALFDSLGDKYNIDFR